MNDLIKINTGLTNIGSDFSALFAEYNSLEQSLYDVGLLLHDTSLWDSESQRKAVELHEVLNQYIMAIRPIYESLQTCIQNLDKDVDAFAGASRNVGKLW